MNVERSYQVHDLLSRLLGLRGTWKADEIAPRYRMAVLLLEKAWSNDIKRWSESPKLSIEDASTGEIVCNSTFNTFLTLILQPLLGRKAYVRLNGQGDINGNSTASVLTQCYIFDAYSLKPQGKKNCSCDFASAAKPTGSRILKEYRCTSME